MEKSKSRALWGKTQVVIHKPQPPYPVPPELGASLTHTYPHLYRYLLASPALMNQGPPGPGNFYSLDEGVRPHDKAHLPTKYTSSRQEAWFPCTHGHTCRSCCSRSSSRQGSLTSFSVKAKKPRSKRVLPKNARLTTSEDFAKATKSGFRLTSENLVGYLYIAPASDLESVGCKCGLIVNKSVGGSVTRHRIARQIRHSVAPEIASLPSNSLLVIRVLKSVE